MLFYSSNVAGEQALTINDAIQHSAAQDSNCNSAREFLDIGAVQEAEHSTHY